MNRKEWEIMVQRLAITPELIVQVDRNGKVIGGPWYFRTGREVQEHVKKTLRYLQEETRLPEA